MGVHDGGGIKAGCFYKHIWKKERNDTGGAWLVHTRSIAVGRNCMRPEHHPTPVVGWVEVAGDFIVVRDKGA